MFTSRLQGWVRSGARRVVPALRALGLTPNILTMVGLVICAGSAVLVGLGYLLPGGLLLLLASGFDILDGALARVSGREQRYGAFLDSTVDRYAEAMTAIALLAYFIFHGHHTLEPMLVVFALTGSLLVSYVRARAQSLGFTVDGGLLARPERVVHHRDRPGHCAALDLGALDPRGTDQRHRGAAHLGRLEAGAQHTLSGHADAGTGGGCAHRAR